MSIEPVEPPVEILPNRRTIVTALPLKKAARERLAQLLGARVVDMRHHVGDVDVVLTPSCSPQLLGSLGQMFPGAQVVVVELDDSEFDIELSGPVKRVLRGGASAYLVADSIDELAAKVASLDRAAEPSEEAHTEIHELTTGAPVDQLIEAALRQSVESSTRINTER